MCCTTAHSVSDSPRPPALKPKRPKGPSKRKVNRRSVRSLRPHPPLDPPAPLGFPPPSEPQLLRALYTSTVRNFNARLLRPAQSRPPSQTQIRRTWSISSGYTAVSRHEGSAQEAQESKMTLRASHVLHQGFNELLDLVGQVPGRVGQTLRARQEQGDLVGIPYGSVRPGLVTSANQGPARPREQGTILLKKKKVDKRLIGSPTDFR